MARGSHLTKEARSKGGRSRGAQKTAAARATRIAKVTGILTEFVELHEETTPELLEQALRGALISALTTGDIWQRLRAAEVIKRWYIDGQDDNATAEEIGAELRRIFAPKGEDGPDAESEGTPEGAAGGGRQPARSGADASTGADDGAADRDGDPAGAGADADAPD